MKVNFELYKVFVKVADSGSLTKAAKELYLSQPAISKSIKQLEEQLGGKLFNRTTKGMELTKEGKMVYSYVKKATELIDMAEYRHSRLRNISTGLVNIGASDTICKGYLLPIIKSYHKKYPDILFNVTNRTTRETISLLKTGKVDIGFVNLPIIDSYLDIKPVIKTEDIFVCDKEMFAKIDHPLSFEELNDYPLVILETLSNSRQQVDRFIESKGVRLKPQIELGSLELVADFARIGYGIGLVTREFVKQDLENGELFEVPLVEKLPIRDIGLITLKDTNMSFAASKFVELLLKNSRTI